MEKPRNDFGVFLFLYIKISALRLFSSHQYMSVLALVAIDCVKCYNFALFSYATKQTLFRLATKSN